MQHHHPRPSPRSASAASNPSTNPEHTNNSRDTTFTRTRSSVDLASYTEKVEGESRGEASRAEVASTNGQDRETTKLNQIIQHFHTKAALLICSSRASLPQVYTKNGDIKQNRWFNIVVDETDILVDDLQEWKRPDLASDRPPSLVIETFLDTTNLNHNQALVIADDAGSRWDVADALTSTADSNPRLTKNGERFCEVVLERWTISLGDRTGYSTAELNDLLPNVYKKGVVLFRSLYTLLRFLPTWKLYRRLGRQQGNHQPLKLKFRIRQWHDYERSLAQGQKDPLLTPLYPAEISNATTTEEHIGQHVFHPLLCPAGALSCAVTYRINTQFKVADAESLLSSQFLGIDKGQPALPLAGRSLPGAKTNPQQTQTMPSSARDPTRKNIGRPEHRPQTGAYSSLGTVHGIGKRDSPAHDDRTRALDQDDAKDEDDGLMDSRDQSEGIGRTSMDYMKNPPFKAGSVASTSPRLAQSPLLGTAQRRPSLSQATSYSPRRDNGPYAAAIQAGPSSARTPGYGRFAPSSVDAAAGRGDVSTGSSTGNVRYGSSYAGTTANARGNQGRIDAVGSPRYASSGSGSNTTNRDLSSASTATSTRYASSFAGRTRRSTGAAIGAGMASSPLGTGGNQVRTPVDSRTGGLDALPGRSSDSDSGRASKASTEGGGESGSGIPTARPPDDDDAIADFLGQLERARVSVYQPNAERDPKQGQGEHGQGFSINLTRYQGLREGSSVLAEEMSHSQHIQQSSVTPPSRRLSNVPGLSTSSSPSRALPHAPHVRSRLSTHSIAEEVGASGESSESPGIREETGEDEDEPFIFSQEV